MIVVIGTPLGRAVEIGGGVAGSAALVALAAAQAGASVELVGRVGDDPAGDELVLALGRAGVGHAALLRDPARATPVMVRDEERASVTEGDATDHGAPLVEPIDRSSWPTLEAEDLELALRYLPEIRTLVVADPVTDGVLAAAVRAATYNAARLVVVSANPDAAPDADLVLAPPSSDPDGAFPAFVGQLAAALERGEAVEEAFDSARAALGASPASA